MTVSLLELEGNLRHVIPLSPLHCSKAALKPSLTLSVHPPGLMPCYSCVTSADTERAVEILTRYQNTLQSPEEQELKASIGKVSHIFQSDLFQALLGKPPPCGPRGFVVSALSWGRSCAGAWHYPGWVHPVEAQRYP